MARPAISPRMAVVLAGAGALVAARGLLSFSVQALVALGMSPGDGLVRLLGGIALDPWTLRSLLWAAVVGAACAAFLPALMRGVAGRDVPPLHAAAVGSVAALAYLVVVDLVQHDPGRLASSSWRLLVAVSLPLAGGLLAALAAR